MFGNKINDRVAEILANALAKNSTLQVLFLVNNNIGDAGAQCLANALEKNYTLTRLDLDKNIIGDHTVLGRIAFYLERNKTSILSPDERTNQDKSFFGKLKNSFRPSDEHTKQDESCFGLQNNDPTHQVLILDYKHIGDRGAERLANALAKNSTLQMLFLGKNNIGDNGAACLVNALEKNYTLRVLFLWRNKIGDRGAESLANVLGKNSTLQELDLNYNNIGDRGATLLANALENNYTLQKLDLYFNNIGDVTVLGRITSYLERNKNENTNQGESFFGKLAQVDNWNDATNQGTDLLEALIPVIADLHQTRLYYTLVANCIRAGLIPKTDANSYVKRSLEVSCQFCKGEDSIVMMKLILDKALLDQYITSADRYMLDNRAELKRVEHAPFMVKMRDAIQNNAANIQNLDNNINRLKSGLRRKQKMEKAVGLVSVVINIVTLGIGGSITDAVGNIFGEVIDFGDIFHIRSVVQASTESREEMLQMVDEGIKMGEESKKILEAVHNGIANALGNYGEAKLEEAIKKKSALVAICATAVMYQPQNHGKEEAEVEAFAEVVEDGAVGSVFPDAILNEEEEDDLPYHAAVKYGDMEHLMQVLKQDDDDDTDINQVDSKGRTAMDLAALTGQVSFLRLFEDHNGKFKYKNAPKMKIIAKNRQSESQKYLEMVHNSAR